MAKGFQGGRKNPYNLLKAKCEKLEEELRYEKSMKPLLRLFAEELGKNLLVVLAQTPYHLWPKEAQTCFTYTARLRTTAAHFYKASLPKEPL